MMRNLNDDNLNSYSSVPFMRRILLLLSLILAVPVARAADNPAPPTSPPQMTTVPPASTNCPTRPAAGEAGSSNIVIDVDPDTMWRPRGAEVRFTVRSPGGPVAVTKVRVCFGWTAPDNAHQSIHNLMGSPQVRSVTNPTGVTTYAAFVPMLPSVPNKHWWPARLFADAPYGFTGGETVPVADMVVEVTTASGEIIVSQDQIGVTNVAVAWGVVAIISLLMLAIVNGISRYRRIKGRSLLLRIISTQDGRASLSQLQVLLWTGVVAVSAIYVMTLSGNLINITQGTLTLLGIASAAALLARVPVSGSTGAADTTDDNDGPAPGSVGAAAVPVPVTPEWADLVIADRSSRQIDITRLQMLAFTLITAGFVLITVIVDYEIPEIPANFLLLMGMSNGVYVTGRRLPSQAKGE